MAMLFQKNGSAIRGEDVRNAVNYMVMWRQKGLDEKVCHVPADQVLLNY